MSLLSLLTCICAVYAYGCGELCVSLSTPFSRGHRNRILIRMLCFGLNCYGGPIAHFVHLSFIHFTHSTMLSILWSFCILFLLAEHTSGSISNIQSRIYTEQILREASILQLRGRWGFDEWQSLQRVLFSLYELSLYTRGRG